MIIALITVIQQGYRKTKRAQCHLPDEGRGGASFGMRMGVSGVRKVVWE